MSAVMHNPSFRQIAMFSFRLSPRVLLTAFVLAFTTLAFIAPATATTPSFRSSSSLNGAGTVTFPAGSVSTDWLVMYVISTSTIATPTNWTLKAQRNWTTYAYYSYVFARQK